MLRDFLEGYADTTLLATAARLPAARAAASTD
jgi:hypothetical protein